MKPYVSALTLCACWTALLLAVGCSDATEPSIPGGVTASLSTPNTDDGAVLVELTGPGIADVHPATSSYRLYWRLLAPDSALVILIGDITAGPLFTARGEGKRSAYAATVRQVAGRDDAERTSLAGYAVTVR
jgi:hypothetical protein